MQENVYFEGGNFKNLQHLRGAHPLSDSPLHRTSATESALCADRAPTIKTAKSRHCVQAHETMDYAMLRSKKKLFSCTPPTDPNVQGRPKYFCCCCCWKNSSKKSNFLPKIVFLKNSKYETITKEIDKWHIIFHKIFLTSTCDV